MNDRDNALHPLHGAFEKYRRAEQLAVALRSEMDATTGTTIIRVNTDTHFTFICKLLPLPTMWGVKLGEITHHCRSCLEHIAWQLVMRDGGNPTKDTTFPICTKKEAFLGTHSTKLAGLRPDSLAAVEELQPYNADKAGIDPLATPIFLLHELWNIEKHRAITLCLSTHMTLQRLSISPLLEDPGEWVCPLGPITDGAEVYRRPRELSGKPVSIQAEVQRSVSIGEAGRATPSARNVGLIMDTFLSLADDALQRADRLFPLYI